MIKIILEFDEANMRKFIHSDLPSNPEQLRGCVETLLEDTDMSGAVYTVSVEEVV